MDQDRREALERVVVDVWAIFRGSPLDVKSLNDWELLYEAASLLACSRDRMLAYRPDLANLIKPD